MRRGVRPRPAGRVAAVQYLEGHVEVERDGHSAEVICADVAVQGGVVHIVDDLLLPVDDAPLELDTDVDREATTPEAEAP
jgi:hypothetical protein